MGGELPIGRIRTACDRERWLVGALTPFQCFVAGVAFAVAISTILIFILWRSVTSMRSAGSIAIPPKGNSAMGTSSGDRSLIERVQELERHVAAMERRMQAEIGT